MKRKFFDWNRPFLPAVAKLIVEEAIQRPDAGPSVDLSRYVYVLSGNRALRTFSTRLTRPSKADESRPAGLRPNTSRSEPRPNGSIRRKSASPTI